MHSLRRFLIVFLAIVASASVVRSAAAAQAYLIADAQTGYILEEQKSQGQAAGRQPDKDCHGMRGVGLVRKEIRRSQWSSDHSAGGISRGQRKTTLDFNPVIASRCAIFFMPRLCNLTTSPLRRWPITSVRNWDRLRPVRRLTPTDLFVAQMNALAKQLKMERTRFVNPHGIDWKVKPLPYSTAEDMGRLTRYAMNKPSFRFYVSQKERQISFNRQGHQMNYVLRNTNELLGKNGIDGVKTGRSSRAGDCLILYANRESEVVRNGQMETVYPRHLMVVLLGSTNRFGEGLALMQRGWQLVRSMGGCGADGGSKKNPLISLLRK